jgi:hypothetical protein
MSKKANNRQAIVSESNGNEITRLERAESDGTWRNRPLWRAEWSDGIYGPQLTLAARQLLAEEKHYANDNGN